MDEKMSWLVMYDVPYIQQW